MKQPSDNYWSKIRKAADVLNTAEYILIGGGAGLSAAAGFSMDGEIFQKNFTDFIQKYGISDLYSGGFYPFPTQEEKWAFWSKHIYHGRYEFSSLPLYETLHELVKRKPFFVISTNVDGLFTRSGFPDDKVFEVQGDYRYFQCAEPCHNKLYDNEKQVRQMVRQISGCRIPSALVPRCPVCGGNMDYNLRVDDRFVQDVNWYAHEEEYQRFLEQSDGKKLILLEMGVGFNTPGVIRFPFERIAYHNSNAMLIRMNRDYPDGAKENVEKTISFAENMSTVLNDMMDCLKAVQHGRIRGI